MGQQCEEDEEALEGMEVLGHDVEDGDVVESAVSDLLLHASQTRAPESYFCRDG